MVIMEDVSDDGEIPLPAVLGRAPLRALGLAVLVELNEVEGKTDGRRMVEPELEVASGIDRLDDEAWCGW